MLVCTLPLKDNVSFIYSMTIGWEVMSKYYNFFWNGIYCEWNYHTHFIISLSWNQIAAEGVTNLSSAIKNSTNLLTLKWVILEYHTQIFNTFPYFTNSVSKGTRLEQKVWPIYHLFSRTTLIYRLWSEYLLWIYRYVFHMYINITRSPPKKNIHNVMLITYCMCSLFL